MPRRIDLFGLQFDLPKELPPWPQNDGHQAAPNEHVWVPSDQPTGETIVYAAFTMGRPPLALRQCRRESGSRIKYRHLAGVGQLAARGLHAAEWTMFDLPGEHQLQISPGTTYAIGGTETALVLAACFSPAFKLGNQQTEPYNGPWPEY